MQDDRPASSAMGVALARALESQLPSERRLFEDPYARHFLGGPGRAVLRACRRRWKRRLLLGAHERVTPGVLGIAVGRTRLVDDALREGLAGGAEQVVNVGAGYDTRPLRLRELARVPTLEVDHPATQRAKRAILERHGLRAEGLRFVPVDLEREALAKALREAGFREGARTLVVWEGVTEYLDESAVRAVLDWCAGATAPGSELLFTYTDAGLVDGTKDFPGGRRLLAMNRRGGEPYRFGFAPEALAGELARHGLELLDDAAGREFAERYLRPLGRGLRGNEYERTARARVAGSLSRGERPGAASRPGR